MALVKLKDVVMRVKDKVDRDTADLDFYIGGEHFDYAEICISRRGVIQGSTIGPAFHMRFQPGDVLLMSRNPHLRKAGVVDFEGICSDVSYVCRTKDENVLLQRYLPFIFQTDHFWDFAESNKKGSTNFFLNWSDFEKYEFNLPPIEIQRELTELLWAAENTKLAYVDLLRQTDELVKSQFIEMVQPMIDAGETTPLVDLIRPDRPVTYGILKPGTNVEGGIPVIRVKDYPNGEIIQEDMLHTTPEIDAKYVRSHLLPGDLLLSIGGSVGRMAIVPPKLEGANITQHTARLSFAEKVLTKYVMGVLEMPSLQHIMESQIKGVAQKGLNLADVKQFPIPVPSIGTQQRLVDIYDQSDKSKFELKQAIERVTNLMKSLMQQDFAN